MANRPSNANNSGDALCRGASAQSLAWLKTANSRVRDCNLRCYLFLLRQPRLRSLRELCSIPAATESLDQQHAGLEASLRNLNVVTLIQQKGGLPSDHLEVGVYAALVTHIEEIERLLR